MSNIKNIFNRLKRNYLSKVIVSIFSIWFLGALIITFLEKGDFVEIKNSLWWTIVTMTTVGYGDIYPITTGGKIFTSIITLIGIGIVAIPTGLLASSLTSITQKDNTD